MKETFLLLIWGVNNRTNKQGGTKLLLLVIHLHNLKFSIFIFFRSGEQRRYVRENRLVGHPAGRQNRTDDFPSRGSSGRATGFQSWRGVPSLVTLSCGIHASLLNLPSREGCGNPKISFVTL